MTVRVRVEEAITGVLVGCAIVTTVILVRRELFGSVEVAEREPVRVDDWRVYGVGEKTVGPDSAPVTITVFSDFQCPFCARLASSLEGLRQIDSNSVRIVFRSYPVTATHRYAKDAALAAECGANQGRFWQIHSMLFRKQDSIGVAPWGTFAIQAGVPDTLLFRRCITVDADAALTAVLDDSLAGERLGIRGTPTVLINEWRLPTGAPTDSALRWFVHREINRL